MTKWKYTILCEMITVSNKPFRVGGEEKLVVRVSTIFSHYFIHSLSLSLLRILSILRHTSFETLFLFKRALKTRRRIQTFSIFQHSNEKQIAETRIFYAIVAAINLSSVWSLSNLLKHIPVKPPRNERCPG